jgi:hypothetical protein
VRRGLRRGTHVLIDTDRTHAGQPLRGQRGVDDALAINHGVYVCTCATTSTFHATPCPADIRLREDEVLLATARTVS